MSDINAVYNIVKDIDQLSQRHWKSQPENIGCHTSLAKILFLRFGNSGMCHIITRFRKNNILK